MSIFCVVDDKHVPLYRVMWVAATPHFCGEDDCQREGYYEVRLEQDESVWANRKERDRMLRAIERWQRELDADPAGGEFSSFEEPDFEEPDFGEPGPDGPEDDSSGGGRPGPEDSP